MQLGVLKGLNCQFVWLVIRCVYIFIRRILGGHSCGERRKREGLRRLRRLRGNNKQQSLTSVDLGRRQHFGCIFPDHKTVAAIARCFVEINSLFQRSVACFFWVQTYWSFERGERMSVGVLLKFEIPQNCSAINMSFFKRKYYYTNDGFSILLQC